MSNILLLGAGTQSLAIIPSLHRLGHKIVIWGGTNTNYGDDSRYVTRYCHPNIHSNNDLLNNIQACVEKYKIEVIIPMGDKDAEFISKNAKDLQPLKFKMPTYNNFLRGYNKNLLLKLCHEKGYPHPQTLDLSEYSMDSPEVRDFPFPAMLKPNCTTGGRGMIYVENYKECKLKYPELHDK